MSATGIQSRKSTGVRCRNAAGVRTDCGCAPGVGDYNPGGCGSCFPCAFDISFSGQTYRGCVAGAGDGTSIGIVGSLAGPYRAKPTGGANYSGNCLYVHAFSRPVDSLPDPWPVYFQNYTDPACTTPDDSVGLGVNAIELSFGPLMQPILTAYSIFLSGGELVVTYWFYGIGDLATSDGDTFTIQNLLAAEDSIAYDGNGGGWAWGGSATVSRVGTCAASVNTFGNITSNAISYFGSGLSSSVPLVNLPAGDYDISHVSGSIRYAGGSQWQVNNGSDKFVIVAQDPTTLAVTVLGDAPGTSTPRDDPDYIDLEAQDEDAVTVTHPGGYLGIRLDCASYDGNTDGSGFGDFHTPAWCVCIAAATDRNCEPCVEVTPDTGWSTFGVLAPGSYTIEYVRGAIKYADSDGNLNADFQINDTSNSRGFKVRSFRWIGSDPPASESTDQGYAPGDSLDYATTAAAESANDGATVTVAHDGGELQIALVDSISSVHSAETAVTYRLCAAPPPSVDICANTGSDDCPDTVHVSVTGPEGGIFDGLEQDITRQDPIDDPHTWGIDDECSGCAFITCIDGDLILTLRDDSISPGCRMTFKADGTGPCPTGRTWTYITGEDEGCEIPDSVSVT